MTLLANSLAGAFSVQPIKSVHETLRYCIIETEKANQ
jgi:hypothetical protein